MKCPFRLHLILHCLLILIPLFFVVYADQNSIDVNKKSAYLAEAENLIEKENYEEALISYFLAYDLGLPRDSLFYLWAELYLKKGDLDSALAVNQSALEMCSAALKKELLKQRFSIYVFLGADEAALKISRELGETDYKIKPGITPYLNTGINLKGEQEKLSLSDPSYWTHSGSAKDPVNRVYGTYYLSGNIKFTDLPSRFPDFSLGTVFQLRRNTELSTKTASSAFDSLSIESGGYYRLDNLWDRLGVELRTVYNQDSYKTRRWTHGLVYSFLASEKIFSVGTYNIALKEGRHYDYQQGFISVIFDILNKTVVSFSPSLNLSCFFTRNEPVIDASYSSFVYVDVAQVQPDKLPLFYLDAQKQMPLDTSGLNKPDMMKRFLYAAQIENGSTPVILEMPLSHFRIEPVLSAAISLHKKWTVKPAVRWGLDIYNQIYRWNKFYNVEQYIGYVALNCSDNSYYQIIGMNSVGQIDIELGEKIGSSYSQRRFDTDIQGSVSIGHTFKRAGNIIFSLELNKSWTSLPSDCPVEINDWSVAFTTDWQCSINLGKRDD